MTRDNSARPVIHYWSEDSRELAERQTRAAVVDGFAMRLARSLIISRP